MTALQLTGQSTPSGRIPFLRYTPADTSKPQPCIIFLHGQNKGSNVHDTTSVLTVMGSDSGLPYLCNAANPQTGGILPSYTNLRTGETFEFYVLAPQLYYSQPYPQGSSLTTLWKDEYILQMINYARTQLNVDWHQIHLTGYSLGAGGTVVGATNPKVNRQIASWSGFAPGYGNGSGVNHAYLAKSGLPGWLIHCAPDTTASISVSDTIIKKIRDAKPRIDPKFYRYQTGTHNSQYRLWDTSVGDIYDMTNGSGANQPIIAERAVHSPNWFQWLLLQYRAEFQDPLY